ncbi:MAG: plastocyanin/azurin family copper-binding protein [Thermoplasmata archaeon]|nr:plastocyanin/azurin family copper-binding protein [Thermoplasmata archaeon]
MATAADSTAPASPTAFIVGAFALAAILGGAVLYLGLAGDLGSGIPGAHTGSGPSPAPTGLAACEGRDRMGNFTFSFVAGLGGTYTFNATSPGPCVAVVAGSSITVRFYVAGDAGSNHTWVLVNASNASKAMSTPAFAGAGMTGAERFMGIAPGNMTTFHFVAGVAGTYQYICEMPGHYAAGMWGWFNVTTAPATTGAPRLGPLPTGSAEPLASVRSD